MLPLDVVAEEGEGRIAEKRRIGLALFDELLQLAQLRSVHCSLARRAFFFFV